MASRLPLPGSARPRDIEIVTSVPFNARGDVGRRPLSHTQARVTRGGLWRLLVAAVAVSGITMMLGAWWWSSQLPESQKRAAESEALLAPPSASFCSRSRPPMVCAHGGDTTHAPPNTVSAFRNALAAGADCVEIDAAMSKDGVLIVMHVRELAQLLGGSRKGVQVGDLPSSELLALRWPSGEYVMSVEEAVRLTSPFVDVVTLDVKNYNDKSGQPTDELAMAEALVGLVAATRCTNCLVWAKSDRVVRRILELSPGQRTGYIVMNETEESRQLGMHQPLRFGGPAAAPSPHHLRGQQAPDAPGGSGSGSTGVPRQPASVHTQPAVVGVHFAMVEPALLNVLHGAGKQLYAWTINHAEVLRAVLDVGVDALVTNYPLTALEAIESRLTKCGGGSRNGGGRIWRPNGTRSNGAGGIDDDGPLLPGDYL